MLSSESLKLKVAEFGNSTAYEITNVSKWWVSEFGNVYEFWNFRKKVSSSKKVFIGGDTRKLDGGMIVAVVENRR